MRTVWFSQEIIEHHGPHLVKIPSGVPVEFSWEELRAAGVPFDWPGGELDAVTAQQLWETFQAKQQRGELG